MASEPRGGTPRRLIVILRYPVTQAILNEGLADIRRIAGVSPKPLISDRERRSPGKRPRSDDGAPPLAAFYYVDVPAESVEELIAALRRTSTIVSAYVKSPTDVATLRVPVPRIAEPPPVTPDFSARQKYLGPAPRGIGASDAWTRPGGRGDGVQIIDVEKAWNFGHEEFPAGGDVFAGSPVDDVVKRNHGTAVFGILRGRDDQTGIVGICARSTVSAAAIFDENANEDTADAIVTAALALGPGDFILLELHRAGPRHAFAEREDQQGYVAVEWWPDDFAAILFATTRGIIVVEAAGNGRENLDDVLYDDPRSWFPPTWHNPFRREAWDSGAILVGAGIPPGSYHGVDRSRFKFSNYGGLLDAQAWGRHVTTSGGGDLQGGAQENRWYTRAFGGTSSASAMVAGILASAQGVRRSAGKSLVTPATARAVLRATGSPQQAGPGVPISERIGNRPDFCALIDYLEATAAPSVPGKGRGHGKQPKSKRPAG